MKKQFGFIFFFCAYTISYGQYMPILDADTTEYKIQVEVFDATIASEVLVFGDTLIDGQEYREVWSGSVENFITPLLVGFVREDTIMGRLWFRRLRDTNESLIMDLSLNVGDSFQILDEYLSCSNSGMAPVKNVETVDGRKIITLDCIYGGGIILDTLRFIEGVGSNATLFFQTLTIFEPEENDDLIFGGFAYNVCRMLKEDIIIYPIGEIDLCGVTTSTQHINTDSNLLIFPNPTNGKIFIESEAGVNSIQLFDVSGKLLQIAIDTQINLSSFKPGMYILKVLYNPERVSTHKVLKI